MDQARPLNLLPQSELDVRIKRGDYAVMETCDEDPIERLGLRGRYRRSQKIGDECYVFWELNVVPARQ
jgi:prenyltransferase beta subunit